MAAKRDTFSAPGALFSQKTSENPIFLSSYVSRENSRISTIPAA